MKNKIGFWTVAMLMVVICTIGGCTDFFLVAVRVPLDGADGMFEVAAGATARHIVPITDFERAFTVGSGSFGIDAGNITVTQEDDMDTGDAADGPGEDAVLSVTLHVDDPGNLEGACGNDDTYGPFVMSLREDFSLRTAEPSRVSFSDNTLRLFEVGEWSLCVEVESSASVNLEVRIREVIARLGS